MNSNLAVLYWFGEVIFIDGRSARAALRECSGKFAATPEADGAYVRTKALASDRLFQ